MTSRAERRPSRARLVLVRCTAWLFAVLCAVGAGSWVRVEVLHEHACAPSTSPQAAPSALSRRVTVLVEEDLGAAGPPALRVRPPAVERAATSGAIRTHREQSGDRYLRHGVFRI